MWFRVAPDIKSHRGSLAAMRETPRKPHKQAKNQTRRAFCKAPALEKIYQQMHQLRELMNPKEKTNPLKHCCLAGCESTQTGTRTQDQLVKSQLLYQLSYLRVLLVVFVYSAFASRQRITVE